MKLSIPSGTTSKRIALFIQDSSSTTGAGLTGLAFNTASLVCYSWIDTDGNAGGTSQTLATATLGTWTTIGFKEKDATNMPGMYEFGVPNALIASGVKWATLMFKGATNMAPLVVEIEVTAISNQDSVRGGMTALPNAAAEASGGLYTRGTGAGQVNQDANGRIDANVKTWIGGTIPAVNVTGVPIVDDKYLLGTIYSTPATSGIMDINVKNMNNVAATSITTINANQGTTQPVNFTGAGASALAKSDMVDVAGAAVSATTAQVGVNVVNWNNTVVASPATAGIPDVNVKNMNNVSGSAITTVKAVQGLTTADTITTLGATERNAIADALLVRAITESYAALHAAPTVAQAICEIRSILAEFSISGTTITTKKIDGSTTATTATLDSATSPSSRTRAT